MRAGRLQTRRIKVHRRRVRLLIAFFAVLAIGSSAYLLRDRLPGVRLSFQEQTEDLTSGEAVLTLPGETWYALQLGAFSNREAAAAEAEKFKQRGAAGYVLENGSTFRAMAAAYDTRAAAQAVCARLASEHGIETYVIELSRGEMTARCHGQNAQLTALKDAYDCLSTLSGQMYALSCGLDERTKSFEETLEALLSMETTLRTIPERLSRRFPDQPEAVRGVLEGMTLLAEAVQTARTSENATALSGRIKYAQLLSLDILSRYTAALY